MIYNNIIKKIFPISLIIISFLVFVLMGDGFIRINDWDVSIVMLLGFIVVIIVYFLYINFNHRKGNNTLFKIKFLSENSIKLILLLLILICVFIPSHFSFTSILLWEQIFPSNFFRAIIVIIGCAYLPGANIYKIIFPRDNLVRKLDIEPFFIKITFYPLLSFSFLGVAMLLFDQCGIVKEQMIIFLLIAILVLFLFDFIVEIKRKNTLNIKLTDIQISKYTFIILLLAIGISTISLGVQLGSGYLVSGDPWDAIKYANLIGDPNKSPIYIDNYPNFWGYISFGLGIMSGLPFINVNTLLAPFSYLFITSIYLFMKSLLINLKEIYAVFSTLLLSMFSGLFYGPPFASLIYVGEYYFYYKSFSYVLFFSSLALFFTVINKISNKKKKIFKTNEFKILILGAYLLVISFITYMLPLFLGIIFLFVFCLVSENKKKYLYFKNFLIFAFFIIVFLLILDLIYSFYLSHIINIWLLSFFPILDFLNISLIISTPLLMYSLFISLFFLIFLLNRVLFKSFREKQHAIRRNNIIQPIIFQIVILIFTIFLLVEIDSVFFKKFSLSDDYFLFLILDNIYLNIGFIGIIGVCLSYFSFKKSKNLSYSLIIWILLSFIFAFSRLFLEMIKIFPLSPQNVQNDDYKGMMYWFDRVWFYSIPPLCILAAIGILELIKVFQKYEILNKRKFNYPIIKNISLAVLIYLSFSGIITTGLKKGNKELMYDDAQIKTLNWISANIPLKSRILVGGNFFMLTGVDSITFVKSFAFTWIFRYDYSNEECYQKIEYLKQENIQYAVISSFYIADTLHRSDFVDNVLVPEFYNYTLFQIRQTFISVITVYYAPYFNNSS